jgi:hypothetical protein
MVKMVDKKELRGWISFPQAAEFENDRAGPLANKSKSVKLPQSASSFQKPPQHESSSSSRRQSKQPHQSSAHHEQRDDSNISVKSARSRTSFRSTRSLPMAQQKNQEREGACCSTSSSSASDKKKSNEKATRSQAISARLSRGRSPAKVTSCRRARSSSRTRSLVSRTVVGDESKSLSISTHSNPSSGKRSDSSSLHGRSVRPQPNPKSNVKKPKSASQRARSRSASLTRVTGPHATILISSAPPSPRVSSNRKPPSTLRTRQELISQKAASARSLCESQQGSLGLSSVGSADGIKVGTDIVIIKNPSPLYEKEKSIPKQIGLMEKLFGDQVDKTPESPRDSFKYPMRPRVLLAATVYHNEGTNLWITTINTNQRGVPRDPAAANRFLKAFSFATENEAREAAIANAPPKMIPFVKAPACYLCKGTFAVFRRASHCRNCGVCVCPSCSTSWPAKCIPNTYNPKQDSHFKVCLACHTLSSSFKSALLRGNYDEAIALYTTGNINLRTPFPVSNKKDEVMYPVHSAVEGGSIDVLKWLLNDHCCPIKLVRSQTSQSGMSAPLVTSKGRSVLTIAIDVLEVDVIQYLVAECGVSVHECTDLKNALRALETVLSLLPVRNELVAIRDVYSPRASPLWDASSFDGSLGDDGSALGSV